MWAVLWTSLWTESKVAAETIRALLDKALKRREELRLESDALDNLINTYKKIQNLRDDALSSTEQLHLWHGGSQRALHSARVAEMLDTAKRIIVAEGRPMKRGELVKRLESRGFSIAGGDKNKVFGTNVWRSGRSGISPAKATGLTISIFHLVRICFEARREFYATHPSACISDLCSSPPARSPRRACAPASSMPASPARSPPAWPSGWPTASR